MRQMLIGCWKALSMPMSKLAVKSRQSRCQIVRRLLSSPAQNVARLTVPPLRQTLDRFLITARPLLTTDMYQQACQLVEEFEKTGGRKLQTLLEERAENSANWLEEWWTNYAYLEYRLPAPIHVNPGILLPQLPFSGLDSQLRYAANFIARALEYKNMVDVGAIPVEYMNGAELCMSQYYHVLGGCRTPGATRDVVKFLSAPKHITVVHNGHIFSMDVYGNDGQPLTSWQLYQQLVRVVSDSPRDVTVPIGLLTSQHRDAWFKDFAQLSQDETNRSHLLDIQRSIFVLSLDKSVEMPEHSQCQTVQLNQVHHGGGSHCNSINRWFDKILQVFVSPNGFIGFNYEHSTAEGPPVVHLIDFCCSQLDGTIANETQHQESPFPRRLDFNLTAESRQAVDNAAKAFDGLINDLDLIYFSFDKFGKKEIKMCRVSPDAFIQVSFQLAYYRLYRQGVATYESGSLRKFHHGRTDTIRSCSQQSQQYCEAMNSGQQSLAQKAASLRAATDAHSSYTQLVVNGNGIDRHLLGLKLIAAETGLPLPRLLTDTILERTCYWQMSTSQVASKVGGLLCFGPVVADGYGICYNPMDSKLLFAISSWKSFQPTDARRFAASLEQSLLDSLHVLRSSNPSSKL